MKYCFSREDGNKHNHKSHEPKLSRDHRSGDNAKELHKELEECRGKVDFMHQKLKKVIKALLNLISHISWELGSPCSSAGKRGSCFGHWEFKKIKFQIKIKQWLRVPRTESQRTKAGIHDWMFEDESKSITERQ